MADSEMREPTFWILTALANGRKHGYALIGEAAELSSGRVQLKVGTLYAALDRLGHSGLVESAGEEVVDGRLRRYYTLTASGTEALREQVTRMESNAREARIRLKLHPLSPRVSEMPA
ncbi:PadR family transcriptional regulator [Glaciihabitans sp. UYNi722]|uniref:PadR family transcriptional regulator n=1 Tax=Glaciihabitans sp. UYNi722 TaxID=3156344 RepID=UPI003396ECCB